MFGLAGGQCIFMCITIYVNVSSLPPMCNPQMKQVALIFLSLACNSLCFALRYMCKSKVNGVSNSRLSLFLSQLEVFPSMLTLK